MRLLKIKPKKIAKLNDGLVITGPRKELEAAGCLPEEYDGNTYQLYGNVGNFLTIDPGLGGTGWAVWSRETFKALCPPMDSGAIVIARGDRPWWWHCIEIAHRVQCIMTQSASGVVYVEQPQFMEAGKGLAAARGGDLIKLTSMFGAIMGACNNQSRQFCPVPIPEWKGNMPKDVFEPRIRSRIPKWSPKTKTSHEIDAVGIGLFVKGHL
jgi:hypothetical protein